MRKTKMGIIIFLMVFCVGIISAQAQESAPIVKTCLDYYAPGDIGTTTIIVPNEFTTGENVFSVGNKIKSRIFINNASKIRIPDGNILIRIEKVAASVGGKETFEKTDRKVVAEFFYPEQIVLNPGDEKWLEYEWTVPEKMENGKYVIKAIAVRGKNPNAEMFSLDYFEKVATSNESNFFTIKDNQEGTLILDQQKTKINEIIYDGKGIDIASAGEIKVTQSLENTFAIKKDIAVEYKLYRGNYFSESNLLDSKKENISLEMGKSGEINYQINKEKIKTDALFPYYLRTTVNYDGIIFVSTFPIFNKTNFNGQVPTLSYFTFLENFPIKKGEEAKVLACVNYPKGGGNSKIQLVLKDSAGKEVAKTEQDISSQNNLKTPVIFNFKAKESYNQLSLEASIIKDNEKQDSYSSTFKAKDFGIAELEVDNTRGINVKTIIIIIFILIIIIFGGWLIAKKRKNDSQMKPSSNGPVMGMFLVLFILGGLIIFPTLTKANSFPFSASQTSGSVGADAITNPSAFLCNGTPTAFNIALTTVENKMRVDGNFSVSGNTLTVDKNEILDIKFLKANGLDVNGTTGKNAPYLSKITTASGGWSGTWKTGWGGNVLGSVGLTNLPTPAIVFSWGYGALMGGVGLYGHFVIPQYFSGKPENLIDTNACSSFNLDTCYRKCCEDPAVDGIYYPATNACTGKNADSNSQYQSCKQSCQEYVANCTTSKLSNFLTSIKNNIGTANAVTLISDTPSVVTCDSALGTCTAMGAGTATISVRLDGRNNMEALLGIAEYSIPQPDCVVSNTPFAFGLGWAPRTTVGVFNVTVRNGSCGNGNLDPGECCDLGASNGTGPCSATCTCVPTTCDTKVTLAGSCIKPVQVNTNWLIGSTYTNFYQYTPAQAGTYTYYSSPRSGYIRFYDNPPTGAALAGGTVTPSGSVSSVCGLTRTFTFTCPVPPPSPVVTGSCDAAGKIVFSWPRPVGATVFDVRFNDQSNDNCAPNEWYCGGFDNIYNSFGWWDKTYTPIIYDASLNGVIGVPGNSYDFWVHSCNDYICQTGADHSVLKTVICPGGNPPSVDLKVNDLDGPIAINSGEAINLSWGTNTVWPNTGIASGCWGWRTNSAGTIQPFNPLVANPNYIPIPDPLVTCNATGCPVEANRISPNYFSSGSLTENYTFHLKCWNSNGETTDSVNVNVNAAPPCSCSYNVTPSCGSSCSGINTAPCVCSPSGCGTCGAKPGTSEYDDKNCAIENASLPACNPTTEKWKEVKPEQ